MAAYLIADVDVKDAALFEEYRRDVPATEERYGGRYLGRGGATKVLEGDWDPHRLVIVEFPDMAFSSVLFNQSLSKSANENRKYAT
ncbi:DUF1330 domain-containing protein [Mesorhizobium sp. M0187]|uniref:DUF1330 domain-containing protein n=1 Tax=Mesorhizobium sp. M0187 TaxID=2956908 RepID=UPI00333797CC